MSQFVLDTSVVMAWCFKDEVSTYAMKVLESLGENEAIVPGVWPLEVGNVLLVAERKNRISEASSVRFIELLYSLPIAIEYEMTGRVLGTVIALAKERTLSTYDASYLDLAMKSGKPIATLDSNLRNAARKCAVSIYEP